VVGRVFAETCRAMREGFAQHYQLPAAALHFFDIPHVHSAPFVEAIATIIARYAPTAHDRAHLQQVAEAMVAYEQEFYDALMAPMAWAKSWTFTIGSCSSTAVMNLADTCQGLNFAKLVSLRDRAGGQYSGYHG